MSYRLHRVLGGFAALAVSLAAPVNAQGRADVPCPAIVTTGEAVVREAPNRAFVTVTTEARAGQPEPAQRQSANAMSSVHSKLKSLGISAEAIRTLRYDLQPEYDHIKGRRTLRGYLATNTIEVRIDELSRNRFGAQFDGIASTVTKYRVDVLGRTPVVLPR